VIRDVANKKKFGELPSGNGVSNADNVVLCGGNNNGLAAIRGHRVSETLCRYLSRSQASR
jgi:hypothetical protein